MDDLQYGKRNKRGDWSRSALITPTPVFVFPPRPVAFLKWLPHYFLPWNIVFMVTAALFWYYLTPSTDTMKVLAPGWIAFLLIRNMVVVFLFYGALELHLYIRRKQGNSFKYNARWPSEVKNNSFMFGSQNLDNMIRSFGSGVPIWTAYEVLILWCYANGWGPWTTFARHPVWLIGFGLALPIIHELHFFCVHRLIHLPPLYRAVHSVHHNSVNPSPWSSLSMHPIEHLLYWSGVLLHLIVPSHPLLALYDVHIAGFGAVVGHIGFDKIVIGEQTAVDSHTYAHYLHHKYFEVNYGDGLVPLDRLFGTAHDGSTEADDRMNARLRARVSREADRGVKRAST